MRTVQISVPEEDIKERLLPGDILAKHQNQMHTIVEEATRGFNNDSGLVKGAITASVMWLRPVPDETPSAEVRHNPLYARNMHNIPEDRTRVFREWSTELDTILLDEEREGSGWSFEGISRLTLYFIRHGVISNLRGHALFTGGGRDYIINPSSQGHCLIQAIGAFKLLHETRGLYDENKSVPWHVKRAIMNRTDSAEKLLRLGVKFSPEKTGYTFDEISVVENMNNYNIFVYKVLQEGERRRVTLCRGGKNPGGQIIPLLCIDDIHIALITHLPQFVHTFARKNSSYRKKYRCPSCLWGVDSKIQLTRHMRNDCLGTVTVKMPAENYREFSKFSAAHPLRYTCFWDIESAQTPKEDNPEVLEHKAIMHASTIVDRHKNIKAKRVYTGPDAVDNFIDNLFIDWRNIRASEEKFEEIQMTKEDWRRFNKAKSCPVCKRRFGPNVKKVRHHLHSLARDHFLYAACFRCNAKMADQRRTLTCIAHNGNGYDIHLLLKERSKATGFRILPKSANTYHSVEIEEPKTEDNSKKNRGKIRFIDSRSFLSSSLSKLAATHIKSGLPLEITKKLLVQNGVPRAVFPKLLSGKGVIPYRWIDSVEKLKEKRLPPKEVFFNDLTKEELSDEAYNDCQEIWRLGNCQDMKRFVELYILMDVGLLSDVMMSFRDTMFQYTGLDPFQFVSLPGLAWESMLKKSGVKLELLTDMHLYSLFNKNIRGGLAAAMRTKTKANNRFCRNYDKNRRTSYILYIDFNSLYGTVMSQFKLPVGNFEFFLENEIDEIFGDITGEDLSKFFQVDTDGEKAYFLLVDTFVPAEVALKTDDLPLSISKLEITEEMLSPRNREYLAAHGRTHPKSSTKLVASHLPQEQCFMHVTLLKELMSHGLKVSKLHEVYRCDQSRFMKSFVDENVRQRSLATSESERNLFKLFSNALYGKCCQNPLKHRERLRIIEDEKLFLSTVFSPFFKRCFPIREDRVACVLEREEVELNSPIYIGMSILDLAKVLLYRFFHGTLKKIYGENVQLCYSDTDSLIIRVFCNDIYEDIRDIPELNEWIDTSNFPEAHFLHDYERKGRLGLLKSETADKSIEEAICLRAKCYSLLLEDGTEKRAAKGVPYVCQKSMTHEMFRDVQLTKTERRFLFHAIRVKDCQASTAEYSRIGMNAYDDKRYIIDEERSVNYGHPSIPQQPIRVEQNNEEPRREFCEKSRVWREEDVIQNVNPLFRDRTRILDRAYPEKRFVQKYRV